MKRSILTFTFLSCITLLRAQLPANGLKVHIPFDNAVVDMSSNQLATDTIANITYTNDRFGNANASAFFNGYNSYVKMDTAAFLDFSTNKTYSTGLWFYTETFQNSTNDYKNLIGFDADCNDLTFSFQMRYDSTIFFGSHSAASTGNFGCWNNFEELGNTKKWHLATVTSSETNCIFYIDGVAIENRNLTSAEYSFFASHLMIGAWSSRGSSAVTSYFTGRIDDVFLYDRILTAQEVSDIYNHTPTSLSDNSQTDFEVYPNPVNNNLTLENLPKESSLEIIDAFGRLILAAKAVKNINTTDWQPGLFFVLIKHNNTITTKRILKR